MRLPLLPILLVLVINALVDFYIYRAVSRRSPRSHHRRTMKSICLWSSVVLAAVLVAAICWPKKSGDNDELLGLMWVLFGYFSIYIPKYVYVIFDLLASVPKLLHRHRLKWLSATGIGAGVIVFGLMWWGALINRYRIQVNEVTVSIPTLPKSFSGLKIAQISDLHVGTYGHDTTFVAKLVERVNSLHPDMIVFTGDIVNRRSDELIPFAEVLSHLEAPMGVYSILGNHDYGDYYLWPSENDKADNLQLLKDTQRRMGWKMLNNTTEMLHNGNDSIALIGVENVGDPPFHCYGNLDTAYPGDLEDPTVKILLSHNPAHWTSDICDAPDKNIALTLSGHTHAMQMELFGVSPAAMRYPTWGGRYSDEAGQTLYVNIGTGEVAIPARIGATPEITLLTITD